MNSNNPAGWDRAVKEVEEINRHMNDAVVSPDAAICATRTDHGPLVRPDTFDPKNAECHLA